MIIFLLKTQNRDTLFFLFLGHKHIYIILSAFNMKHVDKEHFLHRAYVEIAVYRTNLDGQKLEALLFYRTEHFLITLVK